MKVMMMMMMTKRKVMKIKIFVIINGYVRYICDIEVNDYNSVIFPERDLDSKLVFQYCFDCSDSLVDLF